VHAVLEAASADGRAAPSTARMMRYIASLTTASSSSGVQAREHLRSTEGFAGFMWPTPSALGAKALEGEAKEVYDLVAGATDLDALHALRREVVAMERRTEAEVPGDFLGPFFDDLASLATPQFDPGRMIAAGLVSQPDLLRESLQTLKDSDLLPMVAVHVLRAGAAMPAAEMVLMRRAVDAVTTEADAGGGGHIAEYIRYHGRGVAAPYGAERAPSAKAPAASKSSPTVPRPTQGKGPSIGL
jgi:hypothetical protein